MPAGAGRVNIVFVLLRTPDPGLPVLWDLIAPVREAGDRVEFWLPLSEARPSVFDSFRFPDLVIHGAVNNNGSALGDSGGTASGDIRHYESILRWLEGLYAERRPELILFPETPAGRELGTRLAARINGGCFPETRSLLREGKRLFARKKVCGSNIDWDAVIAEYPAVLTVAGTAAVRNSGEGGNGFPRIETRPIKPSPLPPWILAYERAEAFPSRPLETAPLIFAAGRGLGSGAACDRLRRIAGRFGAPLGFSRPAALNGWGELDGIIGQSGLRSGAKTCVAVGVSGAAAFMAGIESVSTLIAINPDRNAPIFRYADIGIITGAEEFIAALETELKTEIGNS
jgi:electron transfer flavoprotein alpha subunit